MHDKGTISKSAKYVALINEDGEGCDYTIACGQTFIQLEARKPEDIRSEIMEIFDDHGMGPDHESNEDDPFDTIHVVEVSKVLSFSRDKVFSEDIERRKESEAEEERRRDEAELKRLTRKLKLKP
jgi:hypothetical protein